MKKPTWVVHAVWCTTTAHIRDVLATQWLPPSDALVRLIAQPGSADCRTRVEVRPAHATFVSEVAIHWLEGLAERLLVAGSAPRTVED